jgi:hypothetical protein
LIHPNYPVALHRLENADVRPFLMGEPGPIRRKTTVFDVRLQVPATKNDASRVWIWSAIS